RGRPAARARRRRRARAPAAGLGGAGAGPRRGGSGAPRQRVRAGRDARGAGPRADAAGGTLHAAARRGRRGPRRGGGGGPQGPAAAAAQGRGRPAVSEEQPLGVREFQERIEAIYLERGSARGKLGTFAWLVEEIGELSRALRRGERSNLEE